VPKPICYCRFTEVSVGILSRQVPISIKVPVEVKEAYDKLDPEKKEFVKMVVIAIIAGLERADIPRFTAGSRRVEVKLEVGDRLAEVMERMVGKCMDRDKEERLRELIRKYEEKDEVYIPAKEVARILRGLLD